MLAPFSAAGQDIGPEHGEKMLEMAVNEESGSLVAADDLAGEGTDLNLAGTEALLASGLFTPLQVESIVRYRSETGAFLSVYELQFVPGIDSPLIRKAASLFTVNQRYPRGSLFHGEHLFTTRVLGSHHHEHLLPGIYFRYRFTGMSGGWGLTAENDRGEKKIPDFLSMHFFIRGRKLLRKVFLGDFRVNLGQGLLVWQGFGFGKSVWITGIQRLSEPVKPYTSSSESGFMRGAAAQGEIAGIRFVLFGSVRKIDANVTSVRPDGKPLAFASLETSGTHDDYSGGTSDPKITGMDAGGSIGWTRGTGRINLNGLVTMLSAWYVKSPEPYNSFLNPWKSAGFLSADHSFTFRNFHFAGEAAVMGDGNAAVLEGCIISLTPEINAAMLIRRISAGYSGLHASAFTERSVVNNENGLFLGIDWRCSSTIVLRAYLDNYRHPWLLYYTDAPSAGNDAALEISWAAGDWDVSFRLRDERKGITGFPGSQGLPDSRRRSARLHVSCDSQPWGWRVRIEKSGFADGGGYSRGYLVFNDLSYKPMGSSLSFVMRYALYTVRDWDARIYAYEHDAAGSFLLPAYYGEGAGLYGLIKYKFRNPDGDICLKAGWKKEETGIFDWKVQFRLKLSRAR